MLAAKPGWVYIPFSWIGRAEHSVSVEGCVSVDVNVPSDYEYYLMGLGDAREEPGGAALSRWRFNVLYGEFLRAKRILKDRAFLAKVTPDSAQVLQYTGATALDEMVSRGRVLHNHAVLDAMPPPGLKDLPPEGPGPPPRPPTGEPYRPPEGPGSAGSGDRMPLTPREPVLAGAGARPLPRENDGVDLSWWRT
jgi:hypothetical protein